jgi:hypothetical protein
VLTKGTANQVLTSDGTDLSWATAGGGIGSFDGTNLLISSDDAAGDAITDGTNNIFLGEDAGGALTVGDNNIAIGHDAFNAATTGATLNNTIAIGTGAMGTGVVTGADNIAIGQAAGADITTGQDNVYIGNLVAQQSTTGSDNVAIGRIAMYTGITTGDDNVCIGRHAGNQLTSGIKNVYIGRAAGLNTNTGSYNVAIGEDAGDNNNSGDNNVHIGNAAHVASNSTSNECELGNTSTSVTRVQVDWTITSDERDKANIKPLVAGLDFINDLKPVSYQSDVRDKYFTRDEDGEKVPYTPDGSKMIKHRTTSFLAQDVLETIENYGEEGLGDLVFAVNPDQMGLQRTGLIVPLVKAVQELSAKVTAMQEQLDALA